MRKQYDFSKGTRGAIVASQGKKARITIRIDAGLLDWFRAQVERAGGGNYQTLINDALKAHVAAHQQPLEKVLRRIVREELKRANAAKAA